MKKRFIKTVSIMLCLVMLISTFSIAASAMSVNEGMSALRSQWSRGVGPEVSGRCVDYSYYSPKKNKSDKTKYPLCIFMAGAGEGGYEGEELVGNKFAYWSGEENQAKFKNAGGAYLLIARSQDPIYWDTMPIDSLKAAIDDFATTNPNVDTDRIYVIGWCLGAVGATRLITAYPDSFAGAVLVSNRTTISATDAAKLKDMSVWLVHCTTDSYSLYNLYCAPSWKNLKAQTSDPNKLRLTTCKDAPNTGVLLNHVLWNYLVYDCTDDSEYEDMKTVNGFDEVQKNITAISWISQWSLKDIDDEVKNCSCQCHSTNAITKLIWNIKCIFYKIFSSESKRVCACGKQHW